MTNYIYNTTTLDNIDEMLLFISCVTSGCEDNKYRVKLKLKKKGKWKKCEGYLDPENNFKTPKTFSRRVMTWSGKCVNCGREYEASLRITQGE